MKSKPCKSGRRRRKDGHCSRKPGRKRSSPCRYGVKKSGACRRKSGRKASRRRSSSRSASRKASRKSSRKASRRSACLHGRKKSGGCKRKPGPKKGSRRGSAKANPVGSPVRRELARLPSVRRVPTVHSSPVARELARLPSVGGPRAPSPVRRMSGGAYASRPFKLDESPVKTPAGYKRLPSESPDKFHEYRPPSLTRPPVLPPIAGPAQAPARRAPGAFGMCSN